jgi:hypothetical protein
MFNPGMKKFKNDDSRVVVNVLFCFLVSSYGVPYHLYLQNRYWGQYFAFLNFIGTRWYSIG